MTRRRRSAAVTAGTTPCSAASAESQNDEGDGGRGFWRDERLLRGLVVKLNY